MAFQAAAGWGNLPLGNFSPVIYSKKVQLAFRKSSVISDITTSEYFGEISNFGDSVKIMKEPELSVSKYVRGTQIQAQDLIDEDYTLVIDQANYFAFKIDDIEEAQSHVNWMSLATDRAGYRLRDNYDQEVLAYIAGYRQNGLHTVGSTLPTSVDIPGSPAITGAGDDELLASNRLNKGSFSRITTAGAGDHSIPVTPRLPGATSFPTDRVSPLDILNRMGRVLDQQNVPSDGRWIVLDPVFIEMLKDEDSRLFQSEWGKTGGLRNGRITDTPLHGFRIYESNNLPSVGTGPATAGASNQNTAYGVIVAGHDSANATAEQINKTEKYRDPDSFADVVRGMHLYGRKRLRPEAVVTAKYNVA